MLKISNSSFIVKRTIIKSCIIKANSKVAKFQNCKVIPHLYFVYSILKYTYIHVRVNAITLIIIFVTWSWL